MIVNVVLKKKNLDCDTVVICPCLSLTKKNVYYEHTEIKKNRLNSYILDSSFVSFIKN